MLFNYFRSKAFHPEDDIPSLKGKTILISGGTDGMGKQSVLELSRHNPHTIWIAARNLNKARAVVEEILQSVPQASLKIVQLDLSSLKSVTAAAQTITTQCEQLDLVLLSAGVMTFTPGVTEQGYDKHFGVDYMGHALLVKLLIPLMEKTSQMGGAQDVRVVMVSSAAYAAAPCGGINFSTVTGPAENLFDSALRAEQVGREAVCMVTRSAVSLADNGVCPSWFGEDGYHCQQNERTVHYPGWK